MCLFLSGPLRASSKSEYLRSAAVEKPSGDGNGNYVSNIDAVVRLRAKFEREILLQIYWTSGCGSKPT